MSNTSPVEQAPIQSPLRPTGGGGVIVVGQNQAAEPRFGQGLARGMATVMRHFAKSFTNVIDDKNEQDGMFTVEYPEVRMELPEAARNMPILLYEDSTGQELCTACFQCERICPPKVIHITQAKDPATGKPVPAAEEFVIEYDSCMSCGFCHEICPFDAIKMDHDYELSTPDHLSMDVRKAHLNRSISYYQSIAPNLWAEVQANALKKLQNNIKRRPGTIGVAPNMVGRVGRATSTTGAGAAKAAPQAASRAAAPAAAIGKNMSADKRARLEAIRAAKRGMAAPVPEAELVEPSQVASPEAGTHTAESQAGLAPSPATSSGPVAAIGSNMSEEKRARLEAIRAAKRAQRGGE